MALNFDAFKQQLIEIKYIFNRKKHDYSSDMLSSKIWDYYINNAQNYKLFSRKIRLKNELFDLIKDRFSENGLKYVELFISGSTANGFASIDSDIDLSFFVTNYYDLELVKSQKLGVLSTIQTILYENQFQLIDEELIDAKVPILRFIDNVFKIRVEINVNNQIGIRNTRLLYCYSKLDWRVVPICIAIKKWAKVNQIIDSFSGALSSYCVELMVIFYLQCCRLPVLPCLQEISGDLFDRFTDIKTYEEMPDLSELPSFESLNNESLGELFIGFFKYYLFGFDFTKHVASVRLGRTLLKENITLREDPTQWEYICVEEPFNGCNAGRTVYDSTGYQRVIEGFKKMYTKSISIMNITCNCS